ncbi:hypothetical protein ACH5RR_018532 [Cinchona calisaya]|uniref:Uncharacterized protein n=1 Tax=Cinchona calisaya TaxID=153742 RepID=A0ABD2ZRW0_9GENT
MPTVTWLCLDCCRDGLLGVAFHANASVDWVFLSMPLCQPTGMQGATLRAWRCMIGAWLLPWLAHLRWPWSNFLAKIMLRRASIPSLVKIGRCFGQLGTLCAYRCMIVAYLLLWLARLVGPEATCLPKLSNVAAKAVHFNDWGLGIVSCPRIFS